MKSPRSLLAVLLGLVLGPNPATLAADAPSGTIEGRVYNAVNGTYLNNARATVAHWNLHHPRFPSDLVHLRPLGPRGNLCTQMLISAALRGIVKNCHARKRWNHIDHAYQSVVLEDLREPPNPSQRGIIKNRAKGDNDGGITEGR